MLRRHNKSLGVTQFLHAFHLTHNSVKNLGSGPVTALQSHGGYPTTLLDQNNTTPPEKGTDHTLPHTMPARPAPTHHTGPGERGNFPFCDLPLTVKDNGRKVCLFHFLFEMLENLGMAHCVSWVPVAADGGFRFSSRNKEQVAALWGQRKGNRRPMTYQKMSRALRNYTQSGEIFKVKKKLTYQFSRLTLSALRKCHQGKL
uniref:Transcription factor Spi-C n=1 Tax=Oncorhynchus mykiss TaxID=8022 RepID=A0A8C7TFG2_ONCMY